MKIVFSVFAQNHDLAVTHIDKIILNIGNMPHVKDICPVGPYKLMFRKTFGYLTYTFRALADSTDSSYIGVSALCFYVDDIISHYSEMVMMSSEFDDLG